jgi:uncharacterized protein (DUF2141 family)
MRLLSFMTKTAMENAPPTGWACRKRGTDSNDAKGTVGAPSFEAVSFSYNGQSLDMTITLQY